VPQARRERTPTSRAPCPRSPWRKRWFRISVPPRSIARARRVRFVFGADEAHGREPERQTAPVAGRWGFRTNPNVCGLRNGHHRSVAPRAGQTPVGRALPFPRSRWSRASLSQTEHTLGPCAGVGYKARQTRLNRRVALKTVLSGVHTGEIERQRFAKGPIVSAISSQRISFRCSSSASTVGRSFTRWNSWKVADWHPANTFTTEDGTPKLGTSAESLLCTCLRVVQAFSCVESAPKPR
jgi:hypothetical protein